MSILGYSPLVSRMALHHLIQLFYIFLRSLWHGLIISVRRISLLACRKASRRNGSRRAAKCSEPFGGLLFISLRAKA